MRNSGLGFEPGKKPLSQPDGGIEVMYGHEYQQLKNKTLM